MRRVTAALLGPCLLALLIGCGNSQTTTSRVTAGAPAPAFSFTTFAGDSYTSQDLQGRPVILNFWAAFCPACGEFAPKLEAVYQKHKEAGLFVVSVSAGEPQSLLEQKAKSLGLTYPLASSEDMARAYGITAIPMTYLIDREGRVQASLLGAQDLAALEKEVEKIL
ncbi:MAG: TlpA family protein disulfide reductase [Armatimonadetes bacterium]|nr:TlpA family protein disulfide reductase [Armatimonadota bacterium]